MKKILFLFLTIASAQAETLYVFKGTNGFDVAARRPEFNSFDLGTSYIGGEHPDVARWKQDVRLPFPSVWPALIDRETGAIVPVIGTNVDAAVKNLDVAISNKIPDSVKSLKAKIKNTKGTNTVDSILQQLDGSGSQIQRLQNLETAVKLLLMEQDLRSQK